MGAVRLAKAVMYDERYVGPVSVTFEGEYGITEKVSLSIPCVIGKNGVEKRLPLNLPEEEVSKLKHCAKTVPIFDTWENKKSQNPFICKGFKLFNIF